MQKVQKDLFEVFTTDYWDNGTYTIKEISHHPNKQEAEEQRLINKHKNLNK
jgi:hypothetical protein